MLSWTLCGLIAFRWAVQKQIRRLAKGQLFQCLHLSPKELVANIAGTPLKVSDLERAMSQHFKSMRIKRSEISETEHRVLELAVFESLVGRMILLQEATRRGFSPSPNAIAEAKNEILKTLPEGMTPASFMSDMGISMMQFEREIADDMAIAMMHEKMARENPQSFERLIEKLEANAKVELFHAPGGGKWNQVGQGQKPTDASNPKRRAVGDKKDMHWRDQSKQIRREKAEETGLKPWDEVI